MLREGETAPTFERPAAVDGAVVRSGLDELVDDGHGIVVLAFYPADFGPGCSDDTCLLEGFDLFAIGRDVSVVGVSTDSAYSHRAFADRYDLGFPLVSDGDGEIAEAYGVLEEESPDGHRRLARWAVFVLEGGDAADPSAGGAGRGAERAEWTVEYAWTASDPEEIPDLVAVRKAIESITDDEPALERYRMAYEWYEEGRAAYDRGIEALAEPDWLTAADAFDAAIAPLSDAAAAFDAARRTAEDEAILEGATTANEGATERRNAARWYAEAAERYARGEDDEGDEYRADADERRAAAEAGDEPPRPEDLLERSND
ncbi:redoxin domain-containing protein [Natrialbaceae archaeon GCM10025810]|uniref:redoxin domain-containing protein n=1 Tax=Halovalidus salilacus TaxID=3075124 RepID=UPI003618FDC1